MSWEAEEGWGRSGLERVNIEGRGGRMMKSRL